MSVPLYSRMSVTSKNEIRYEGTLLEVNAALSTITLAQVRALGTEGRRPAGEIPPSPQVFEKIVFRGTDIKVLDVIAPPPPPVTTSQQPQQPVQPQQYAAPAPSLPMYQQQPGGALPRKAEVSRMSRLFTEEKKEQQPAPAPPAVVVPVEESKKSVVAAVVQQQQKSSSDPAKQQRSVFDSQSDKQPVVVTVDGLGSGTTPSQVRQLFADQDAAIVNVKLMSLPSGGNAADVVFTDLDSATRAVQSFSHLGMTARHFEKNSMQKAAPNKAPAVPPPQVARNPSARMPPTVAASRSSQGGGGPPPFRMVGDEVNKSTIGSDFDFSASNAKFEKSEFAAQAAAASAVVDSTSTTTTTKQKSFFDDVSMSQNIDSTSVRIPETRKKNAETFGSMAYAHRGSGAGGYRGGGRGRGGGSRGRGGGGPPTYRGYSEKPPTAIARAGVSESS